MKTLTLALGATTALLATLRAKGRPPEEDNTFGLPDGRPIESRLKEWFRLQAKAVLGEIPTVGTELPTTFPPLANYDDPMASAMTPVLGAFWQEAGDRTRAEIAERTGLDPAAWEVTDPHLAAKIRESSLAFCRSTNRTTSRRLDAALADLRDQLHLGLVDHGESVAQLTRRVKDVFEDAESWRARRIAITEASRAVHAAQLESARESGVVSGSKWLLSSNACPLCHKLAEKSKDGAVPLGGEYASVGHSADFASIKQPPAHPGCRCTITFEIDRAAVDAANAELQSLIAEPEPEATPPAEPAAKPGEPILPGRPIAERLAAYTEGDRKVAAILALEADAAAPFERIAEGLEARRVELAARCDAARSNRKRRALLWAEYEGLYEEIQANRRAMAVAVHGARSGVLPILEAAKPMHMTAKGTSLPPDLKAGIWEAMAWLKRTVAAAPGAEKLAIPLEVIPDGRTRSFCTKAGVSLGAKAAAQTVVHEVGHYLDFKGGTNAASQAYLEHRVGAERPVSLNSLGYGFYGAEEKGRKDDFGRYFKGSAEYYCGKDYGPHASEILSMGLEALFADPIGFARADPEYCKFVLGVLDGSLR